MRKCIYCRETKEDNEFSLEHIIPQFLGGAQAPDNLKTKDVCKVCNSNLGLFVDASFQKDFLVYNQLNAAAEAFFDPKTPVGLPLKCLGNSDLKPPKMKDNEICECWLGPLGEQIYWIRPKDERMYWYSGGNPRTVKKIKSRAYFMFSTRTPKNPMLTWFTCRDAFEGRKVEKIMCTKIEGADPTSIGFKVPDKLDTDRIEYFIEKCSNNQTRNNEIRMYIRYDLRFLAKLSIGLAYVLFGEKILNTKYMDELYKTIWFREGNSEPKMQGNGAFSDDDSLLQLNCGVDYGTTITILKVSKSVVINLNIGKKLNWLVKCVDIIELSKEDIEKIGDGICIILFKTINKGIELSLPELIAHNLGSIINPDLEKIYSHANKHKNYFQNL